MLPLSQMPVGWGHQHPHLTLPCGTALGKPYRLQLSLVTLGHVTGLINLWFVPGLGKKQA